MKYKIKIISHKNKSLYFTRWDNDVVMGDEAAIRGTPYDTKEGAQIAVDEIKNHKKWAHLIVGILPTEEEK